MSGAAAAVGRACTVAVQLATAQDRGALRDRLAAVPDLRLHPDKREVGLLHLAIGSAE